MATTVRIPLALASVNLANSNAFYTTKDGTNFDYSYVSYLDAVTGITWWTGIIPQNVAPTPAWNLVLYHHADSGSGGNVVLTVTAKDFATGDAKDAALTSLHSSATFSVNTSANLTVTTLSGTNYDGTEAVAAGNRLIVEIQRVGGSGSDTVNATWNLEMVSLRIDIAS